MTENNITMDDIERLYEYYIDVTGANPADLEWHMRRDTEQHICDMISFPPAKIVTELKSLSGVDVVVHDECDYPYIENNVLLVEKQ